MFILWTKLGLRCNTSMMDTPAELAFPVSIVMQRLPLHNRWQAFQWKLLELLPAVPGPALRRLAAVDGEQRWLFSAFAVHLFADEVPGYFLNLSSDQPCWFVMSRLEQREGLELAVPQALTLSYNEAARWMDGGEQVETLPLAAELAAWLAAYTQQHYQPEVRKARKRPSFEGGAVVEQMARAEATREEAGDGG